MNIPIFRIIKNSYWLRSGSYTFATKVFETGVGALTFIILIRLLTKEQFGVWVLFMTISTIIESLRTAFISVPLIRHINTSDNKEYDNLLTASIIQNIIYTIISGLLIIILANPLSHLWKADNLEEVLYIFAINNLFLAFFSHCNFIQQANLLFSGTFYAFLIRKGLFFLVAGISYFYYKNISVSDLVIAQTIIFILIIPLNIYFTRSLFNKFSWSKSSFFDLLNFGKITLVTNINSMVFKNIDSWLLGSMLTVNAVALYNSAIRMLTLIEIPIVTLSQISFPQLSIRFKSNQIENVRRLYEKSLAVILAVIIPSCIIVIIFAKYLILFFAGKEYIESSHLLRIIILFSLFLPFNRQLGLTLNSMGNVKTNMYFVIVNVFLNIICNYIGILYFGMMGAAVGTLISYILSFTYGQILGYYLFKTSTLSVIKYLIFIYINPKKFFKSIKQ